MSAGTTWTAFALAPDEGAAYALADGLEALAPTGVGCFEIEDGSGRWEVGGYFDAKPDEAGLALLAAAHGAAEFVVSAVPARDWVTEVQRALTPVRARRVAVFGAHDRACIPPNALAVEIEAAMAFGTGHHATTEGVLLAMQDLARAGWRPRRVADIGCGTGVLAMAAVKLWPTRAVATDIDPTAAAAAAANAVKNGCHPRLRVGCAPGLKHPEIRAGAPYDLILANILARPLKRMAGDFAAALAPGGAVILSGLLTRQSAEVSGAYAARGLLVAARRDLRGWRTLTLRRPPRSGRGRAGI